MVFSTWLALEFVANTFLQPSLKLANFMAFNASVLQV